MFQYLMYIWFIGVIQHCCCENIEEDILITNFYSNHSLRDFQLTPKITSMRLRCITENNTNFQNIQTDRYKFSRVSSSKDIVIEMFKDNRKSREKYRCKISLKDERELSRLIKFHTNTSKVFLTVQKEGKKYEKDHTCYFRNCSSSNCSRFGYWIIECNNESKTKKTKEQSNALTADTLEMYCRLTKLRNCTCSNEILSKTFFCQKEKKREFAYDHSLSSMYAGLTIACSILGIIGNILVLAVAKSKRDLPTCQKLIACLAVCDLTFAVFQIIQVARNFKTNTWIYGSFLCKLTNSFEQLGTFLAMGIILVISIERYIGITNPFSRGLSVKLFRLSMVVNIIFGLIAAIPLFIFNRTDVGGAEGKSICMAVWPNRSQEITYNSIILILYFAIPLCVVIALYIRVAVSLIRNVKVFRDVVFDEQAFNERASETRRAIIIMISIVTAFTICVLPQRAIDLYFDTLRRVGDHYDDKTISSQKYNILNILRKFPYPFHVAINPIIYSLIDSKWRKDVARLVFGRRREPSRSMSATIDIDLSRTRSQTSAVFYPSSPPSSRGNNTLAPNVQRYNREFQK